MTNQPTHGRGRALLPYVELGLALAAAALWYSTGGAVWYRENAVGLWPVVLVLLLWPLHWASRSHVHHPDGGFHPGYVVWFGLFMLSAGVSVWAAYDRQIAIAKLGLLLGAVGLAVALAHQPTRRHLYVALSAMTLALAGLGLFFVLTNDWAAQPLKIPLILRLGEGLSAALPELPGHRITANVAGGMLAALLPLAATMLYIQPEAWLGVAPGRGWAAIRVAWGLALLAALLGLLLSVSRGAWLGLAMAVLLWGAWRWIAGEPSREPRRWRSQLVVLGLLTAAMAMAALMGGSALYLFGLPGAGALAGRLSLWRDGLVLAQDYAYSGVGLGLFMIPFSIYSLLIHVGYTVYSHNMWIDILAEQGLFGLTALLLLMGTAVVEFARWRRHASRGLGLLLEACLISILVVAVHGLVDSVLYGSRGVLILFVPLGIMMAATGIVMREAGDATVERPSSSGAGYWGGAFLVIVVALVAVTLGRPVTAWHANLGAVAQTQAELQVYDPERFHDPDMDQVRRQVDLTQAKVPLERAARSPAHPTAPRRLAAIALARGAYPEALALMQATWDAGNRDVATRLLYGDALVANGHPAEAARVIDGLTWAIPRLEGQGWARYWAPEDYTRAAYAYEALALLRTGRVGADERVLEARRRAGLPPLE